MNFDSITLIRLLQQYEGLLKKAAGQPHLKSIFEDAFSQARLSLLQGFQSYDPARKVPLPAYLKAKVYGDLRTLFKQERRYWQRESLISACPSDDESISNFWNTIADPVQPFEDFPLRADLQQALSKLPLRQKSLIKLLYFQEKTQKEAARTLGITQQAVAALKKRTLKRLCAILTQPLSSVHVPSPGSAPGCFDPGH